MSSRATFLFLFFERFFGLLVVAAAAVAVASSDVCFSVSLKQLSASSNYILNVGNKLHNPISNNWRNVPRNSICLPDRRHSSIERKRRRRRRPAPLRRHLHRLV